MKRYLILLVMRIYNFVWWRPYIKGMVKRFEQDMGIEKEKITIKQRWGNFKKRLIKWLD